MQLNNEDINELLVAFGEFKQARAAEKTLIDDTEVEEAHASAELMEAFDATTAKVDAFQLLVMQKLQAGEVEIVQEGDASRGPAGYVTMPAAIGCDCPKP